MRSYHVKLRLMLSDTGMAFGGQVSFQCHVFAIQSKATCLLFMWGVYEEF